MNNFFQRTYMFQLWRRDRRLGLVLWGFLLGQVFFMWKGVETFPFYHYGMYAAPASTSGSYSTTHIRFDDSSSAIVPLQQLGNPIFWEYQLTYYTQLRQQLPFQATLKETIHHRFYSFPALEKRAYNYLCNDSTALLQFEQQIVRQLYANSFSIWEENFDWVNKKLVLVHRKSLYTWQATN